MAYENKTPKVIREQIIENTGTGVSTAEGTFASDMAAAVALEMSKLYGVMDQGLQIMFVNTEGYEYLTTRAAEYGIYRKPGEKAQGGITVSGDIGAVLPKGAVVQTAGGLSFLTDAELVLTEETGAVTVTAFAAGDQYNVPEGSIDRLQNAVVGIRAVTNGEALSGGVDEETDEALRARLLSRLRTAPTSGNAYHYEMWALETPGVGGAKVIPLAHGPGTVEVLIVDGDKQPPEEETVEACAAHIEEMRPIGATVTVVGAKATEIAVSAKVTLLESAQLEQVRADFAAAFSEYLSQIAFDAYSVSINKIGYLLMGIEGIVDYSELLLNGAGENVTVPAQNVPVPGGVSLEAV